MVEWHSAVSALCLLHAIRNRADVTMGLTFHNRHEFDDIKLAIRTGRLRFSCMEWRVRMRPTGADVADSSETDISVTDTYVWLIYIYYVYLI